MTVPGGWALSDERGTPVEHKRAELVQTGNWISCFGERRFTQAVLKLFSVSGVQREGNHPSREIAVNQRPEKYVHLHNRLLWEDITRQIVGKT